MRKKTGELQLFQEIWGERPHKCVVCGESLPWFDVRLMAHVLGKGAEPAARLDKENIVIMCFPHHHEYDHDTYSASHDGRFKEVFELKERIRQKYNGEEK